MRRDRRKAQELRKLEFQTNVFRYPEGSAMIRFGDTTIVCSAAVEDSVPPLLGETGTGWVTTEYSILPRTTNTRGREESSKRRLSGGTMEIQRLVGRSLHAIIDLEKLGERSTIIDCDVIQADGGTRTASITEASVMLRLTIERLLREKRLSKDLTREHLAAVNVGILPDGTCVTDLDYQEDSVVLVDMNLVMTEPGKFVEIQGTEEEAVFDGEQLNEMLFFGKNAIEDLIKEQKHALLTEFAQDNERIEETKTIIIATGNPGKAEELRNVFKEAGYRVKILPDYPELPDAERTGSTFKENARLKAETIAQLLDRPVLADDSGLKVDALGGIPGAHSIRFAGEQKSDTGDNTKLLYELTDVPDEKRTAQFHCAPIFTVPKKDSLVVEAGWPGRVARIPSGGNGFRYDPLFIPEGKKQTTAELSSEERNKISHRTQAVKKLNTEWEQWPEGER